MHSCPSRRGALLLLHALLAVGISAGLGACSTLRPKLEAPELTMLSVAMTSADMFNQQFVVRMNVKNPNDRELSVKTIDYEVFLAGDAFAEGEMTLPLVVPALGETQFDMPVRTHFVSSLGRLISRINGQRKVDYAIQGTVKLSSGMIRKIPFRHTGEVDLTLKK